MSQINEIEEVLQKLDIASYLDREGVEYRETTGSSGDQLNLRTCPLCGGSKWKVFLNAESGLGNCFHGDCDKKFNKLSFIKAHIGLGGRDLMNHIKNAGLEQGWRPPRKRSEPVKLNSGALVLPNSIELPYKGKNLAYLDNRGITADIAKYFNLLFCLKGWFKYQIDGRDTFMNFDNRVIIPIFNINGELVSFQGRDITGQAEKKYLFPTGFAVTGSYLYNAHNVKDTARICVGEGVFDVMAIKIAFDEDQSMRDIIPIGTFGKHLSLNQEGEFLKLKEKGIREVTFMWDGEIGAIDAAIDNASRLKQHGFNVRIALLPKDKDPNEVASKVVRDAFYSAMPLTLDNVVKIKMLARSR